MKIRTNYVSNSSSSSFLIIYNDINDFNKLEKFDCYKTFINDINESKEDESKNFIKYMIQNMLYQQYECFSNFKQNIPLFEDFYDIMQKAEIPMKEYNKFSDKIVEIGKVFLDEIKEKISDNYHLLFETSNFFAFLEKEESEFVCNAKKKFSDKFYEDDFRNQMKEFSEELAEKIYNSLKRKGYVVKMINYEDDNPIGCMMEHYFMPFIKMNPERNYEVFISNEH